MLLLEYDVMTYALAALSKSDPAYPEHWKQLCGASEGSAPLNSVNACTKRVTRIHDAVPRTAGAPTRARGR
jgi:hypothetical protein